MLIPFVAFGVVLWLRTCWHHGTAFFGVIFLTRGVARLDTHSRSEACLFFLLSAHAFHMTEDGSGGLRCCCVFDKWTVWAIALSSGPLAGNTPLSERLRSDPTCYT